MLHNLADEQNEILQLRKQYDEELIGIRNLIVRYNEQNDMDDAEGDLYLLDLMAAIIIGKNPPAVIQLDSEDIDLILTGITDYVMELNELGYGSFVPTIRTGLYCD